MINEINKKILIIEDDAHIAEGLRINLVMQGYEVTIAPDGLTGLELWESWQPDLIVLDIMLPGMNGINVLQKIRIENEWIPILILSAKATVDDKITGLTLGVDDYLSKPFNLEEFLLRVNRLLSRSLRQSTLATEQNKNHLSTEQVYIFGNNRIDFTNATAYCKSGEIQLTDQEIKLLKLFIANKGKLLARNTLLKIGWGYSQTTITRTLDNFIVRFRKYFEDNPKKPIYFKSHRSFGYIFDHD
ncbi:MAG: response regulator transcription factor [Nitrospirae bacterium]|nr:response regulator transcription factor [Nitrospirota bacterium]